jgi:hypothetical protein
MRGVGRRDHNSRKNVRNVGKDSSASDTGSPEAPTVYRRAVPPACAANCAAIVSAHDASGDTGQNCDRGILTGNREFWPVSSESDGTRFGLANRRLQPLGHLTAHLQVYATQALTRKCSMTKGRRRIAFKPSFLPLSATTRVGCIVRALLVSGTTDWAHSRAHLARFLPGPFKETEGKRKKATVSLTVAFSNKSSGPRRWAPLSHFGRSTRSRSNMTGFGTASRC